MESTNSTENVEKFQFKCNCGKKFNAEPIKIKYGKNQIKKYVVCPACSKQEVLSIKSINEMYLNFKYDLNTYVVYYEDDKRILDYVKDFNVEEETVDLFLAEKTISTDLIKKWEPEFGEWCLFNMTLDDGLQHPVLMKYGEQDYEMWDVITPFIGEIPHYLIEEEE